MEKIICQEKISTLERLVTIFSFDKRHPDYKRILTKLLHAKNIINYIPISDQLIANFKTELYTKVMILFDTLETKASNVAEVDLVSFDNENNDPHINLNNSQENIFPSNLPEQQITVTSHHFSIHSLNNQNLNSSLSQEIPVWFK